jgi:serine protease Do
VTEVQPDSPAAKAGLQSQDVIVEFGGSKINSPSQLQGVVARSPMNTNQHVVVLRNGKHVDLTVNLREMPTNYGEKASRQNESNEDGTETKHYDKLGMQVGPLTNDVAQQLGMSGASGVVITAVEDGSPADKAGLAPSQVITQVGRKTIKSVAEFEAEVKNASPEKGVMLLVRSAEGSRFVVLKSE